MGEITSPVKAIRAYCLECVGNQPSEVRNCEIHRCPLHPFRFGKSPFRSMNLTDEERNKRSERLKSTRKNRKEDETSS